MKTKEELNNIKLECEDLAAKLQVLSDDELDMVTGGSDFFEIFKKIGKNIRTYTSPVIPGEAPPSGPEAALLQGYRKDPGIDKNAKVIFDD